MGNTYLAELADVMRGAGLAVVEVDGWQYRARGSGGYDGGRPWAVVWHHTASQTSPENDVNYICYGCPDAPVANLYLARDGVVWVCAGGATNTNGKGGPYTVSRGTVPLDRMNEYAVSVEMANSGLGEAWPQVQIDAAFALSLALTDWLGLEPTDALGHVHWTPGRKIDPATAAAVQGPWRPSSINTSGSWSLDDLHAELLRRHGTTPTPEPDPGEDMAQKYYVVTGANAKFIGVPPIVEWTGPGTDKQSAAINDGLARGTLVQEDLTGGPNAFSLTFLRGPLPTGDTLHDWTGGEFAGRLPGAD